MQEGDVFKTKSYGDLIVTKYINSQDVHVMFINTGYQTVTLASNIRQGLVKDRLSRSICGVGITGDIELKVNGQYLKEYMIWKGVLRRCYSEYCHNTRPTYAECSMSKDFQYFPYFMEWCSKQTGFGSLDDKGRPFTLDKDILIKGNKLYSEDACCFVPYEINNSFLKRGNKRGEYLIGVCKRKDRFIALLSRGNSIQKFLGSFATEIEAFNAYKQAKEAHIKSLAEKWKDQIDLRVYEALVKYEVEITD